MALNFLKIKNLNACSIVLAMFWIGNPCYISPTFVALLVVWRGYYRDETPLYTKFQPPSLILRWDRGGTDLFQGQKGGTPVSSLLIDLGGWFFDMLYNFWFSINSLEKEQCLRFDPSAHTPPP